MYACRRGKPSDPFRSTASRCLPFLVINVLLNLKFHKTKIGPWNKTMNNALQKCNAIWLMPGEDLTAIIHLDQQLSKILFCRRGKAKKYRLSISNYKRHSTLKATTRTFLRSISKRNSTCSHILEILSTLLEENSLNKWAPPQLAARGWTEMTSLF